MSISHDQAHKGTAQRCPGGQASPPLVLAAVLFIVITALCWAAGSTAEGAALLLYTLPTALLADRLRRADRERRRLVAAADRHRRAVETNDDIVQHLSAARWSLQAGNPDRALEIMDQAVELGHRMVSDQVRDAELGSAWTGPRVPDPASWQPRTTGSRSA